MDLFKLVGTIAVNNSDANSAISDTTSKAESMGSTLGNKFQSAGNTMTNIGKKLAPVSAGITAVGGALVGIATKTASTTDKIDKMSQKLGISRTAYQEWDYILSQNGASIDSMKMGMKTLNGVIDSVSQSGSTAGTAFERLGISFDDLKGKSQEEIFEMTISALQNCKDETERTALANDLLGRSGQELAPLLNSGAEATEALRQKAHDLGLVLGDETVDAGVKMTDAMDTMKRSFTSIGGAIATAVMPYITKFADYVSSNMPKIRETINSLVKKFDELSPTIKKVIGVVTAVLAVASPVLVVVGKFTSGIGGIITKVGGAVGKISSLVSSFGGLSGVLGAITSPVGLVVMAITALIAIFVTLYNTNEDFRNTVQTAWATIKETISGVIEAVKGLIQAFITVVKAIWDAWGQDIMNVVTTIFNGIATFINNALNIVKGIIQTVTALIKGDWSGVWEGIKATFSAIWETIKGLISSGVEYIKSIIQLGLNVIQTVFSTIWNAIKSLISTIWEGIKTAVSNAVNAVKTTISNVFEAIKTTITNVMNGIKTTISNIWNAIKTAVTTVINAIKSTISSVFNAIKSTITNILNGVKSTFSSVWNGIKSIVSNVINGVKSTISNGLNGAKNTVTNVLNAIKSAFSNILNGAKNVVSNVINGIKGLFNFSWSLPKLKLPHVNISGSFSLTPPSVPHFSIDWYKKAMGEPYMFTDPTLFSYNPMTGQGKVAGEAGDEMMYGHQNLMNDINQAVGHQNNAVIKCLEDMFNKLFEILEVYFPEFTKELVLDTGVLVAETAPAMDEELGKIYKRKGRS